LQRRRLEDITGSSSNLPGSSHHADHQASGTENSSPVRPSRQSAISRAQRRRGVASRGRRLERFRARRKAIAAAERAAETSSDESGNEDGEEEEARSLPEVGRSTQPPAEDISGDSKKLSPPVQKARKLLMVSMGLWYNIR
jgi:hypothetical protein